VTLCPARHRSSLRANPLTKRRFDYCGPQLTGDLHAYVNHTKKESARGEVQENRAECLFSLLQPYLRVLRGISNTNLPG
jgi:hypothetical protein